MKTLAVISQKGGAGKTTLSLHLAVAAERRGYPVAVLDVDPQASAAGWADGRKAETPFVTSLQASRLSKALEIARSSGVGLAIIDTAPHSADATLIAAEAADLILIPCRAGILDLRAISTTARIAKMSGKPSFGILNHAPPRAPRIIEDANTAMRQHGLLISPIVLHQRSVYGHALTVGQTAEEYEPNGKAAEEISDLFSWIMSIIKIEKLEE